MRSLHALVNSLATISRYFICDVLCVHILPLHTTVPSRSQTMFHRWQTYLARGGRWMHVDMAGPVTVGERATGYGVALLFGLARALA